MNAPTRPVLRWHGGKWKLAPWIISYFPGHRYYVEPFAGAASILLRKPRCYSETINDLDCEIVNLFQVLRDEKLSARLIEQLYLTPFSRTEFDAAYQVATDPVERARQLIALSYMGYGGGLSVQRKSSGFRVDSKKSGSTPVRDWVNFPQSLRRVVERLRGVGLENISALELISRTDDPETLFYLDPPYLANTRSRASWHSYAHELSDSDHVELLELAKSLRGMVVLSGYASLIYDELLSGWQRVEKPALADGARKRTEVLWINPRCSQVLDREVFPLMARSGT
ncbi:MAG: DNA adenine methylase [Rhodobacteraceae bacterium]|nr:DNA adenine methylase [Paracoccaceae bacterium]